MDHPSNDEKRSDTFALIINHFFQFTMVVLFRVCKERRRKHLLRVSTLARIDRRASDRCKSRQDARPALLVSEVWNLDRGRTGITRALSEFKIQRMSAADRRPNFFTSIRNNRQRNELTTLVGETLIQSLDNNETAKGLFRRSCLERVEIAAATTAKGWRGIEKRERRGPCAVWSFTSQASLWLSLSLLLVV